MVATALVAAGCSAARQGTEDVIEHRSVGTFAALPNPLPAGAPGTLIRSERLLGAPDGAAAGRIPTDRHSIRRTRA